MNIKFKTNSPITTIVTFKDLKPGDVFFDYIADGITPCTFMKLKDDFTDNQYLNAVHLQSVYLTKFAQEDLVEVPQYNFEVL